MVDEQHHILLDGFFSDMGQRLSDNNLAALSSMYYLPAVFMNEGEKTICSAQADIEQQLTHILETGRYSQHGKFAFDITQRIRLSDRLFFVQVVWRWIDAAGESMSERVTSYTLQEMEDAQFRIVVSVADECTNP